MHTDSASAAGAPDDYINAIGEVAYAFGLPRPDSIESLGGTATRTYSVVTGDMKYVVRTKPVEFSDTDHMRFTHRCLVSLADSGVPVPRPL